jgi:TnpA family transposase
MLKASQPSAKTFFAGLIAQGCNIGINKMAYTSQGILASHLRNTVNWYFTLKNLRTASDKIVALIQQLSLSNVYLADPKALHTSSDGRKVGIAIDSLLANYSFKYFGKDKGYGVYTFIDERQSMFYSTVFSASDREAAYVIDGLLHNDSVKSDLHSTDTHGFTESVFGASFFIPTEYAPRFKDLNKQTLYGFSTARTYSNKGYAIYPKRPINKKLIKNNWDDIL